MPTEARKIIVTGRVQGVGYRPFVYVTAHELGLAGSVLNGSGKVFIHAEGPPESIDALEDALLSSAPPLARPRLASSEVVEPEHPGGFEILASDALAEPEINVPPDLFTCEECVAELTSPQERRFGYPFINCTQCGPRYTIITAMPYDRPNTSMSDFPMCDECRAEYESPLDRRFHAQPLACPVCGPKLTFLGSDHREDDAAPVGANSFAMALNDQAKARKPSRMNPLLQTVTALESGRIVAIKGVGGYHLVCDAASDAAVRRLRERKRRPDKPLAVMFPIRGEDGLEAVREKIELDEVTAQAIIDPARPIVLARKREPFGLSQLLAPGLRELGVFLPYSPLHHELLQAFGRPIVATSGNISGEPVITENAEAQRRLAAVADDFLHHDRPIVRPADDPVLRPMARAARTMRLGRGIAPLERELRHEVSRPVLATGGHLKVTVALAWSRRVVVSPHIGELESPRSNDIFKNIISDIQRLYDVKAHVIACDEHPGYSSSRWAEEQGLPLIRVQHHAAHAASLAGEHPDIGNWLVFTWDGVGYGSDGTLWGGEALAGRPGSWNRVASFRPFRLVGGDRAGREPWRSAAALAWELEKNNVGANSFAMDFESLVMLSAQHGEAEIENIKPSRMNSLLQTARRAWERDINTFETSAAGRLFDAAAALVLGRHVASFEGQGPMELEAVAAPGCEPLRLPLSEDANGVLRSDWAPLPEVLADSGLPPAQRAGIFHETMAQALADQALAVAEGTAYDAVGLSGGVFQNRRLTERVVELLTERGIEVRLHREIPANDGGLCFGQVIEAAALM